MEAIVLAGGLGTRLRSLIGNTPKPMAPIGNRPFLDILLSMLANKGFTHIIISVGYRRESIIKYFGSSYQGIPISYAIESIPLGTGGAIHKALKKCKEDHAFVFNGDTFLDLEVDKLEQMWNASRNPIIVIREVDEIDRFGKVEIDDDRVTGFKEKAGKGPGLINAGCYVLPISILDDFEENKIFSFENDFLAKNIKTLSLNAFLASGMFIDIGLPEDYSVAQDLFSF